MEDSRAVHLVVGAGGMVGRALGRQLREAGHQVAETVFKRDNLNESRVFLDLAGAVDGWKCPWPVETATLCAAITQVHTCQMDPAGTARVNVEGIVTLARNLAAHGAFLVLLSTSHVFDGSRPRRRADEPYSPLTEYGRQKAEAERQLLALSGRVAVVRFTKLVSSELPLLRDWIRALKAGEAIHPFSDMRLAPVPLRFAVHVLQRVIETRLPGILQVSASEDITYEQAARRLAMRLGADERLIQPIRASEKGTLASCNPRHTTLDAGRLQSELQMEPPGAWAAIDSLVAA